MALLAGAYTCKAHAKGDGQGENTETEQTTVDPTNIKTYGELKKVVTTLDNFVNLQTRKSTLESEQNTDIEPEYYSAIPQKTTFISDVYNVVKNYVLARSGEIYKSDSVNISYRIFATKDSELPGEVPTLYVYVTTSDLKISVNEKVQTNGSTADGIYKAWIGEWQDVDLSAILTNPNLASYKMNTRLSYIDEETEESASKLFSPSYIRLVFNDPQTKVYKEYEKEIPSGLAKTYFQQAGYTNTLKGMVATLSDATTNGLIVEKTTYVESDTHKAWSTRKEKRDDELTGIADQLDEIDSYYKTATNPFIIGGNITVPKAEGGKVDLVWPAGCTLDGGNNMVTGNLPLFAENNGNILNMIAPEGRIATDNNGKVKDCIVKVTGGWRVYDDNGIYASDPVTTLESAVYKMRDLFGYDVANGEAKGKVTPKTKLYQAKYADAIQNDVYSFKVNIGSTDGDGAFVYNKTEAENSNRLTKGITRQNSVIYIDNMDVPENVKAWPNVAVRNNVTNETYTCANVTLVDGVGTNDFYVPLNFTMENITYSRNFGTNMFAVCLPFALGSDFKKALSVKVNPEKPVNVWFYTFKEVKGTTIWFQPIETVPANTPCVIAFEEGTVPGQILNGFNLKELVPDAAQSVEFVSTKGAKLSAKSTNSSGICFFGNYKAGQFAGDLATASDEGVGSDIYGFQNGKLVKMAKETTVKNPDGSETKTGSKLHQFRSYIRLTEDLTSPGATPNSFNIGFLDEDGNEVTAIGAVESDKTDNGFKAMGGNGIIEINTDKACDVKVYTASGALAKTVRVESGRTALPFSAGIYIVNQAKVVVK